MTDPAERGGGGRGRWRGAAAGLACAAAAVAISSVISSVMAGAVAGEAPAAAPPAAGPAAAANAAPGADALWQAARADYVLQCAGCHRVDGRGSTPHGIPDFRNSVGAFTHLPAGREYLIRVPGAAYSQLSNAELANVLNWLLHTFSPPATTTWCRCATAWRASWRRWAWRCPTIHMAAPASPEAARRPGAVRGSL